MQVLDSSSFQFIVQNTPLVSIDICLVYKGKILLGRRNNQPLKGEWFTPGGRIFKNEPWQECIRRVVGSELGMTINDPTDFKLMGVWDHFYEISVMDENVSTHYVNLPHYCTLKERPKLVMDQQHNDLAWFNLKDVISNDGFHQYMRNYTSWLMDAGIEND
jgi:colanic acid biosynthesis protein WcaH